MKLVRINFIVDFLAFAAFAFLASSGVLMLYTLPPRSGHATLWGMNRHEWGEVHFWLAMALLVLLAIHILLHGRWIINMLRGHTGQESGWRLAMGIVALLLVIAASLAPYLSVVEPSPAPEKPVKKEQRSGGSRFFTR